MSTEASPSPRNTWIVPSIAVTAAFFVVAALLGFVILPLAQPDVKISGLWDAICSAAGFAKQPSDATPVLPDFKISTAVLSSDVLQKADAQSIGRGATLAQKCAICHGLNGISRADSPSLSGQFASVIHKELEDFKSGARVNAVMTPFALDMSEQDMVDLAAYYAYLPRLPGDQAERGLPAPRIVASGAPMRNIAPCGSCHGAIESKTGSPWLEGQSVAYLKAQLHAFASGERRNDISQQMRNIARQMTPQEIDEAAEYYGSQHLTTQ